jgi:hypothetical protein
MGTDTKTDSTDIGSDALGPDTSPQGGLSDASSVDATSGEAGGPDGQTIDGGADTVPDVIGDMTVGPEAAKDADALMDAGDESRPESGALAACAMRFGDGDRQLAGAVAMDVRGNFAMAGSYIGSIDFGGGPLPIADSNFLGFTAVFDPHCSYVWSASTAEAVEAIAFAPDGSLVSSGTSVYGPHSTLRLSRTDARGAVTWSKVFATINTGGGVVPRGVAVDANGNIALVGQFDDQVDFGAGTLIGPASGAGTYVFIAKFDSSGNALWSHAYGSPDPTPPRQDDHQSTAVGFDSAGSIIAIGIYSGDIDFGGGSLGIPPYPHYKMFAAKLDGAAGAHVWSFAWQDASPSSGASMTPDDGVVLGGGLQGVVDFGNGPLTLPDGGARSDFLVKLGSDGHARFSTGLGGDLGSYAGPSGFAASRTPVRISGDLNGSVDFGGGPLDGSAGGFVVSYAADGGYISSFAFGNGAFPNVVPYVTVGSQQQMWLAGSFQNVLSFGGGVLQFDAGALTSAGAEDIFIVQQP